MKADCTQLKAGVSLQDYVSCNNDVVTHDMQALEQMKDAKLTSDVFKEEEEEEDEEGWKSEPPTTILSALEDTDTVIEWEIKFDVNDNRMAALSSIQTGCPDFRRKEAPTTSGHHSYRTWHCQDGTDRLWQNVGKQLPKYVA